VLGFAAGAVGIALLSSSKLPAATLLALPFLLGAVAGVARLYPYGEMRHSSYLLPLAAGAIGIAGAALSGDRIWPALLVGAVLATVSGSAVPSRKNDLADMNAAIGAIRMAAPPGGVLFTDSHTGLTLSCHLGGSDFFRENPVPTHFWKISAGGYRLTGPYIWAFNANRFSSELRRYIDRLPAGQTVWIVHIGREIDPAVLISREYPGAALPHRFRFGEIAIVEARLR
jgi:hypothetical protein